MKKNTSILLEQFVVTQDMVVELCDLIKLASAELHPLIQKLLMKRREHYLFTLSETVKKLVAVMEEAKDAQKSNG